MEGRRPRLKVVVFERAEFGVLKALRWDGRMNAVVTSKAPGETADSAIGVTPAAIGVCPPSPDEKNLDFALCSPKEVINFRADDLAMLLWGPRFKPGGDSGGLRTSGILGVIVWKVTCAAEGDVQGSVDSFPVQAKLSSMLAH
jgi:hypothetical protein